MNLEEITQSKVPLTKSDETISFRWELNCENATKTIKIKDFDLYQVEKPYMDLFFLLDKETPISYIAVMPGDERGFISISIVRSSYQKQNLGELLYYYLIKKYGKIYSDSSHTEASTRLYQRLVNSGKVVAYINEQPLEKITDAYSQKGAICLKLKENK